MSGEIDPDSGETVPATATSPFPNPCEEALDYVGEARGHIIQQFRDKTRMLQTVDALVTNAQTMEQQLVKVPTYDDPAVAAGVNLDVTGELVGQSRVLGSGTELNDADYRLLIAQRILRNKSIGSGPEFVAALQFVFGATPFHFIDLGNMSLRLEIGTAGPPTDDQLALLNSDVMPRPMAVGINRLWYDPDNYFGFSDDPNADGFGEIGDPPPPGGGLSELF